MTHRSAVYVIGLVLAMVFVGMPFRAVAEGPQLGVQAAVAVPPMPQGEGVTGLTVSPWIETGVTFDGELHMGIQWGCTMVRLTRSGYERSARFDAGNPLFFLRYHGIANGDRLHYRVGIRAGIPLATFPGSIPSNRLAEFNYNNANSAYGWRDPYPWLMNVVPVVLDGQVTFGPRSPIGLDVQISPCYLFSVNARSSYAAISSRAEARLNVGSIEIHAGTSWFISGRSIENNDHDQHAVWIGSTVDLSVGRLRLDVNMNVDPPNGIQVKGPKPIGGVVVGVVL